MSDKPALSGDAVAGNINIANNIIGAEQYDFGAEKQPPAVGGSRPAKGVDLPHVQLIGVEFRSVAGRVFKNMDSNHDGVLTQRELRTGIAGLGISGSTKGFEAANILNKHYGFLNNLSPRGLMTDPPGGITLGGLDIVQDIISGKIDGDSVTLSQINRSEMRDKGELAGLYVGGLPGVFFGALGAVTISETVGL